MQNLSFQNFYSPQQFQNQSCGVGSLSSFMGMLSQILNSASFAFSGNNCGGYANNNCGNSVFGNSGSQMQGSYDTFNGNSGDGGFNSFNIGMNSSMPQTAYGPSQGTNMFAQNFNNQYVSQPNINTSGLDYNSSLGSAIAQNAYSSASNMNSTGYCFRGVKGALDDFGVNLQGSSAWMAADQLAGSGRFKEVSVPQNSLSSLPPGAVVVWGQGQGSPHGHISVALGGGQEASDHVQGQIQNLRGESNYRVFMPVA